MKSYSEYFRKRLEDQKLRVFELDYNTNKLLVSELDYKSKIMTPNIICKKRKYHEAMGYSNDYLVVQEPERIKMLATQNKGDNWIDAYLEHLSNEKK